MQRNIQYILLAGSLALIAGLCTRCTKAVSYKPAVAFQFNSEGGKYISTDVTLNPKDSVHFQFNATSTADMAKIIIKKGLTGTDTLLIPDGSKRSFSFIKDAKSDSIPGTYPWSFTAYDAGGYIIGSESLVVTIKADFMYHTQRILYVPDTTAKTNATYFSTSTGKTYSYSTGAANSADIDFGYYFDTTKALNFTIYALSSNPVPFYDVSTWTKNATIFKKVSGNAMSTLTSGGALKTAGIANLASGTSQKITAAFVFASASTIYFKTAAGKYGAMFISYVNSGSPAATSYMIFEVKVQL